MKKYWDDLVKFFKSVKSEFKRVTWPTGQQLYAYTIVVIVTLGVVTAYLAIVDGIVARIATYAGI